MNSYLIESPFQLLQAYELSDEDKCCKNIFIVRLNDSSRNNFQLKELVRILGLERVLFINAKKKIYTLAYLFPIMVCFFISRNVVIGDENSIIFRILKKIIKLKRVTLLDDGVATLNKEDDGRYERFTIFETVRGKKNLFRKCKSLVDSVEFEKEDVSIIVGSKLVEENICTKECYHGVLRKIIDQVSSFGLKVIYIPHRGENDSNISEIESKFNVVVLRNRLPIELIGYEAGLNPVYVNSVMSTALYSMSLIYDSAEFRVYPLEFNEIFSRKESIVNLYNTMRKNSNFFCHLEEL